MVANSVLANDPVFVIVAIIVDTVDLVNSADLTKVATVELEADSVLRYANDTTIVATAELDVVRVH